ncbi:MAG: DUF1987 domain-containing protein [Bacteroidales bacterium]|nr:DUF1987 domain-containing protein [Bacteroidales bacterium]
MKGLSIIGTNATPEVVFNTDGKLSVTGRSLPENVELFFGPLEEWMTELETEAVLFDINLEYFNSASSKKILDLLKILDANMKVGKIEIVWHYEEGDDDCLESGQIFEEMLIRSSFRYVEYAEAA